MRELRRGFLFCFISLLFVLTASAHKSFPIVEDVVEAQSFPSGENLGEAIGWVPILGGELSNSAATSVDDIDEVMPRMRALGLNTILVPAYWELMEPVEGKFDFTLIDRTIDVARRQQLHVVFLWFGAWKILHIRLYEY